MCVCVRVASRSFARRTCVYIYIIFTQVGNNRYITPKIFCINFK